MPEIEDIRMIKNHLSQEELKHVYLFYGPEQYLKDLYTQRIRDRLQCEPMNCYFFGPEADPRELESICSSVSMFGDCKLVVVSGSGFFKSAGDPSLLERAAESDTYLIFKEDEADKRNKLYKKACECGIVFSCGRQAPAEIKKVLSHTVQAAGRRISEPALQYLLEGIGDDIAALLSETEKLILYVPEGAEIEKKQIDALCRIHPGVRLFDLNDAIAAGNTDKAWRIVQSLLEEKEPPVKIIAILSKMWSQLYSAKLLTSAGTRTAEIATLLGVRDFAAGKLVRQAAAFDLKTLKEKIAFCEELDLSIKSGLIPDTVALELLTVG